MTKFFILFYSTLLALTLNAQKILPDSTVQLNFKNQVIESLKKQYILTNHDNLQTNESFTIKVRYEYKNEKIDTLTVKPYYKYTICIDPESGLEWVCDSTLSRKILTNKFLGEETKDNIAENLKNPIYLTDNGNKVDLYKLTVIFASNSNYIPVDSDSSWFNKQIDDYLNQLSKGDFVILKFLSFVDLRSKQESYYKSSYWKIR